MNVRSSLKCNTHEINIFNRKLSICYSILLSYSFDGNVFIIIIIMVFFLSFSLAYDFVCYGRMCFLSLLLLSGANFIVCSSSYKNVHKCDWWKILLIIIIVGQKHVKLDHYIGYCSSQVFIILLLLFCVCVSASLSIIVAFNTFLWVENAASCFIIRSSFHFFFFLEYRSSHFRFQRKTERFTLWKDQIVHCPVSEKKLK